MRKAAIFIGLLVSLIVCPTMLSAQEEAKPVILIYHGPKTGTQELQVYGEALADLIESDSRIGDQAEIVLVGDQDLMNTLLYFPQVKAVVIALTTWELKADRIVPSTQWYFNQGGGVVGLGNTSTRWSTRPGSAGTRSPARSGSSRHRDVTQTRPGISGG
jgi:hypothetical protein